MEHTYYSESRGCSTDRIHYRRDSRRLDSILHKSMVPPDLAEATVIHAVAPDGEYTILEPHRNDPACRRNRTGIWHWHRNGQSVFPDLRHQRFPASCTAGYRTAYPGHPVSQLQRAVLLQFPEVSVQARP